MTCFIALLGERQNGVKGQFTSLSSNFISEHGNAVKDEEDSWLVGDAFANYP